MKGSGETAAQPRSENDVARLIGYDSWDDYIKDFLEAEDAWRDEEAERGLKAMRLAPSITVYQALMRGEEVPVEALDQKWRKRYRL